MSYGVTRESFERDNAITRDEMSLGGIIGTGEADVLAIYEVLMLDGATGKWESYVVGDYVAGEKLAILKEDAIDATAADAGASLLLAGNIRRDSVATTMTTVLEAQLMASQIYLV